MRKRKTGSTIAMRLMCAIGFIIYIFLFVSGYQASTLMYLQHVLSDGQTHYSPMAGGIVLTIVLMIVQWITAHYTRLPNMFHVLTYIPSMLLLILLTDVDVQPSEVNGEMGYISGGVFSWLVPFIAAGFVFLVIFAKQWIPTPQRGKQDFFTSTDTVVNILGMVMMMCCVTLLANGDRQFHKQMEVENAFAKGDLETIVNIHDGKNTNAHADTYATPDSTLTLYRILALSKRGSLADSLFYAPVTGDSEMLSTLKGIKYYNIHPSYITNGVKRITLSNRPNVYADYLLCGILLSRDLDAFVQTLQKYYPINDALPLHYKEALVLYQHMRSNPSTSFHNDVMEADYAGVHETYEKYYSQDARKKRISTQYKHTYWAYYLCK